VEALAERLSYLVHHPEHWPSMGSAGRKFVEGRYDKRVVAQQLSNLYAQLSATKENGERRPT
jgi:colanic acid/amylovoran biosynthesis glycosyltransferase